MIAKRISDKCFLFLYLAIVFLYTLLLGLQGLDMYDEGWYLTAYQQLFIHPQSAEYQMLYYNGLLSGAIWNSIFGGWGIWSFRLMNSIFYVIIAFLVYKISSNSINRWAILIGIMVILFSRHYVISFNHNTLTATFCLLSVIFFLKSLEEDAKVYYAILAGCFVGINVFTRIPNISMLSLFLVYIVYGIFSKNWRSAFLKILFCLAGVIAGAIINVLIMAILGHLDLFINNLSSGFSATSSSDSTHSLSNLIQVYINNYKEVFHQILIILSIPCVAYVLTLCVSNKLLKRIVIIFASLFYFYQIWSINKGPFTIYAFSFVVMFLYLLKVQNDRDKYLVVLSIIIMFFLPLGSDYGIGNMGPNCVWLAFPLSLGFGAKLLYDKADNVELSKFFSLFAIIFVCSISANHLFQTMNGCYFDGGSRLDKQSLVNHPLATVRTNQYKADIINDLLEHIQPYVKEGDYFLCWQSFPMIHYLTRTYPYLNNSWPWTYDSSNLEKHFKSANKERLPVVLCSKSSIGEWYEFESEWNSEDALDQWNFNSRKIKLFHNFINENNYHTVWENELFSLMLPQSNK